jgi:type VI secretion system protein ImpE
MSPEEALQQSDVEQALTLLQDRVRKKPADAAARIFLFQLLCVLGQWDRALTQLKICGDLDPAALPMVQTYRAAIGCEGIRRDVFAGQRAPLVMGEPERWIALAFEALRATAAGEYERAAQLRDEAYDGTPSVGGAVDGKEFEWIADADSRIGPFLETIVDGKYYWVPFHRISRIVIEDPADLRDMVWTAGQFTWANGGQSVGLIPTRYVGTTGENDGRLQLARSTEWRELADDVFEGLGQRVLATDSDEYSLLDVREIVLRQVSESANG